MAPRVAPCILRAGRPESDEITTEIPATRTHRLPEQEVCVRGHRERAHHSSHVCVPALALQVLNSSTLSPVLASPYMFARKVDLDVDPQVLDALHSA